MQHTPGFVVLVSGALLAATLGCAPEDGTCNADSDCPFGQMCVEDVCGAAGVGFGAGGIGAIGGGGGSSQALVGNVTASLVGVIGGSDVQATSGTVSLDASRVTLQIADDRFNSTFLIVSSLPSAVFAVPGRQTITAGGLDEGYSQACNYDTGAYDEFFNEFVIDVGAPRDPVEGETGATGVGSGGSIEVLAPGRVVDVGVTVAGQGSSVVGRAVVPTAMLGL